MLAITIWLRKQRTFQGHFQPLQETVLLEHRTEQAEWACHALSHHLQKFCLF